MWRYLGAAFLAGIPVPGLGRLPLNAMVVVAFGVLGFAQPLFWFAGFGLELAFLIGLASNERFQKLVDASHLPSVDQEVETKRRALIASLPAALQQRLIDLTRRCYKVEEVSRQGDRLILESNRDALERLKWVYLKLLVAKNNLLSTVTQESERELSSKIAEIQAALQTAGLSENLRESKAATLTILNERLANVQRRKDAMDEVESDLTRIESQVELILENVTMQGQPATISAEIELASLAGGHWFGDSGGAIADLDRTFGKPPLKVQPPQAD